MIEQQRLTYIVPGQFDDAEPEITSTSAHGVRPKLSITNASTLLPLPTTITTNSVHTNQANTNLELSINDIRSSFDENDKCGKISLPTSTISTSSRTSSPISANSSKMNVLHQGSPSSANKTTSSDLICTLQNQHQTHHNHQLQQQQQQQHQTCAQSYQYSQTTAAIGDINKDIHPFHSHHHQQAQLQQHQRRSFSTTSIPIINRSPHQTITEAEAARSLLQLSGSGSAGVDANDGNHNTPNHISRTIKTDNVIPSNQSRSSVSKKNSVPNITMDGTTTNDHHDQSSSSSPTSSMKPDRIVYEVASDLVLLAQNQQLNKSNEIASKMITTDTSVNGNRHSSPIGDRRTSQPTSVIISRHSPPVNQDHSQVSTSSTQRKRIRSDRERSISESSSMVNTNNPFIHLNSPYPMGNSSQQLQLHQQYGVVRNNPTAALIAEEIKRAIATNNVNSNDPRIPFPNNIAHPMAYLQGGGSGLHCTSPPTIDNALLQERQKLFHKLYENLNPTFPPPSNPTLYSYGLPTVSEQQSHHHHHHHGLSSSLSSPLVIATNNNNLNKVPNQSTILSQYHVPIITTTTASNIVDNNRRLSTGLNPFEKESSIGKRKSPIIFQTSNERKNSTSSVGRHFSTSPNVPLPPPPSTPLKPPVIFDPSTISGSDGMDQPIDLSKSSKPNEKVKSDVENLTSSMSHESSIQLQVENNRSPQSQQQSQSSPNHNHRHYVRFRPMMEEKQLTEQLVRAFSPLHDMYPNKPTSNNGREMYKNVRSEEFVHLTPGVHTPHRLPQNMLLLGSRSSSTSTGSSGSGSTTTSTTTSTSSRSISLNNAYSTAEGKSVCNICMKQFSKPSQLRLHINIHFFERPFRCDSCAVSFRTKGHLQKHSRSVSHLNKLNMNNTFGRPSTDNPRPFKCSDCKIAFRIHGHLAKHLRSKMHIMKLECLGKLPFGMFAEMERSNINLTPIDTTDCEKALESLKSLAQRLYDPRQMCWKVSEMIDDGNTNTMADEVIEDEDDELDVDEDEYIDDDMESENGSLNPASSPTNSSRSKSPWTESLATSNDVPIVPSTTQLTQPQPQPPPPPPPPLPIQQQQQQQQQPVVSTLSGSIASTRSNTCHICGRLFKAAKFLQVHLYCDHPEAAPGSEPVVSSA